MIPNTSALKQPTLDTAPTFSTSADLRDATLYISPSGRMIGKGIAHCSQQTVAGLSLRDELHRHFAEARRKELHPFVMGAIPFDLTQPRQLILPRSVEYHSADGWQKPLGPGLNPASALRVLSAISLPSEQGYRTAVQRGLDLIGNGSLAKLVLARCLQLELEDQPDILGILMRLAERHPASFIYSVPLAETDDEDRGALIGASPELLVRKAGNRIFANPLAGSVAFHPDAEINARNVEGLLNSEKDRREHAFASRAVGEALRPYCSHIHIPQTPTVLCAGPINHLSTVITGELRAPETTVLDLALALHPTPAVGGTPTAEAVRAIGALESFDRGLYAGMVGWCDEKGDGEWAITLRCAEIRGKRARLFAGAGIVDGSVPRDEFKETEIKLQTMLSALGLRPTAPHREME
jgi:isochorismate synthase